MIFLRIFEDSYKSWKKYFIFFLTASLIGALNPFFLIIEAGSFKGLLDFSKFSTIGEFINSSFLQTLFYTLIIFTIQGYFPLSIFSMDLQNKILTEKYTGFKNFFKGTGRTFLKFLLPSVFLIFIYAALTILFFTIALFYITGNVPVYMMAMVLCFVIFSYLVLLLTGYFLIPMLVIYKKLKFSEILKYSMELAVRNAPVVLCILIADTAVLVLLTLAWKSALIFYYGISNILRLSLAGEIVSKYEFPPRTGFLQKNDFPDNNKSPWIDLMESKKERLQSGIGSSEHKDK